MKSYRHLTIHLGLLLAMLTFSCSKKSSTSSSITGGTSGAGAEIEVSGSIADEEPLDFVQSSASVNIGGVNLTNALSYVVTAYSLGPSGFKSLIFTDTFTGSKFSFKSNVSRQYIVIEITRLPDGGQFGAVLPPPASSKKAAILVDGTTTIAAKMASIISSKASEGDQLAQSVLSSGSVSVADLLMVAQSVRRTVLQQKDEGKGSVVDISVLTDNVVAKSIEMMAELNADGHSSVAVSEKLADAAYRTVFGEDAMRASAGILAYRVNPDLGTSDAAKINVAFEAIRASASESMRPVDEAFRVEATMYRTAPDVAAAVASQSQVAITFKKVFNACILNPSSCAQASYIPPDPPPVEGGSTTIGNKAVQAPQVVPPAGLYTVAKSVDLSTGTDNAVIHFTTDGSDPTVESPVYSSPILVSVSQTIKAIAVKPGYVNSQVSSYSYMITGSVAAPEFSLPQGGYGPPQTVSLSSATPGAKIYYTIDNDVPTSSSLQYSIPISVSSSRTIKAIAVLENWADSGASIASYVINGAVANPTANPASGTYNSSQSVVLASQTSNPVIYYTTDGSDPILSQTRAIYSGPISVESSTVIKAVASKDTFSDSGVVTFEYIVNLPPVINFSPDSFVFESGQAISPISPINTGGGVTSCSISPALTVGLNFNASDCTISGTPTAGGPSVSYMVTPVNGSSFGISYSVTLAVNGTSGGKLYLNGDLANGFITTVFGVEGYYLAGILQPELDSNGTGFGLDNRYYKDGFAANGIYGGTYYQDGIKFSGIYQNVCYVNGKVFENFEVVQNDDVNGHILDHGVSDSLAVPGNFIWYSYRGRSAIEKRDITTGSKITDIDLPYNAGSAKLLRAGDFVWAFNVYYGGGAWRVHKNTNEMTSFTGLTDTNGGNFLNAYNAESDGTNLYIIEYGTKTLHKVNGTTGELILSRDLSADFDYSPAGVASDGIRVAVLGQSKLMFLDVSDLTTVRTINLSSSSRFNLSGWFQVLQTQGTWYASGMGQEKVFWYKWGTDTYGFVDPLPGANIEGWAVNSTGLWYANTHDNVGWSIGGPAQVFHINLDGVWDKTINLHDSPFNFGYDWNAPKVMVAPEGQMWAYRSIGWPHANFIVKFPDNNSCSSP